MGLTARGLLLLRAQRRRTASQPHAAACTRARAARLPRGLQQQTALPRVCAIRGLKPQRLPPRMQGRGGQQEPPREPLHAPHPHHRHSVPPSPGTETPGRREGPRVLPTAAGRRCALRGSPLGRDFWPLSPDTSGESMTKLAKNESPCNSDLFL